MVGDAVGRGDTGQWGAVEAVVGDLDDVAAVAPGHRVGMGRGAERQDENDGTQDVRRLVKGRTRRDFDGV